MKKVLEQEQESRSCIQAQLERVQRQRDEWSDSYKDLQVQLETEKAEKERLAHKLQEEEGNWKQEKVTTQIQLEHAQSEWKSGKRIARAFNCSLKMERQRQKG